MTDTNKKKFLLLTKQIKHWLEKIKEKNKTSTEDVEQFASTKIEELELLESDLEGIGDLEQVSVVNEIKNKISALSVSDEWKSNCLMFLALINFLALLVKSWWDEKQKKQTRENLDSMLALARKNLEEDKLKTKNKNN